MSWIAFSTPGHGSAFNGTSLEAEPLPVLCFCLEGWDTFFFCFDSSNLLCEGISWFLFWKVGLTITALVTDVLHRISVKMT